MVELVALHREFVRPWPARLGGMGVPTSRYRDNFFAFLALPAVEEVLVAAAADLPELLGICPSSSSAGAAAGGCLRCE